MLLHEDAKNHLLQASPATFAPLQGEAMAYMRAVEKIFSTNPLPKG